MDLGVERLVVGFRERLAVERHRARHADMDVGEMHQDLGSLVARRRRGQCSFEERDCALLVSGVSVQVGGGEQAAPGVGCRAGRRQSKRLFRQLRGGRRRTATLGHARGFGEDRGDLGVGLGRGQRELARPFLGRRDDLGHPSVKRSSA